MYFDCLVIELALQNDSLTLFAFDPLPLKNVGIWFLLLFLVQLRIPEP